MYLVDTVNSENGPVAIFRCRRCELIHWQEPKKPEK